MQAQALARAEAGKVRTHLPLPALAGWAPPPMLRSVSASVCAASTVCAALTSGAALTNGAACTDRVIFRGHNYTFANTDVVCVSDYLIGIYPEYAFNWTLSTEHHNIENLYLRLFRALLSRRNYQDVLFTGTSAGGFPSVKYASIFGKKALIANAQLYLENYGNDHHQYGFTYLTHMLARYGDSPVYVPKYIEHLILKTPPAQIILYNNQNDSTHKRDTVPFLAFLRRHKLEHLCRPVVHTYHGPIPAGKTHHHIQFPNNTKHFQVLQDYIARTNSSVPFL